MKGYIENIEKETLENENYRKVLYTSAQSQLVVMALQPGEEIGMEVHDDISQFIRIEQGSGVASLDGVETQVEDDFAIVVPGGAAHNVTNTGDTVMKLYTIYSPPEHKDGIVQATKADEFEEHFDGVTTE
jgi:mannose-6-phosphate isomerase-like protein (cupin superfamily)